MFSLFIEIIMKENSKSSFIYIVACILMTLIFLYICIIEVLFSSVLINDIFFINNYSFTCNNLGRLDFSSLYLSCFQFIIQLEFHIKE